MAIFGVLEVESTVQINDKTRLSATKSFVSKGSTAISLVEIEPEAGVGFSTVTGTSAKDWFLDWSYSGVSRAVVVSLRITAGTTVTVSKTIAVVTAADDGLFSGDQDLVAYEPDILRWVPDGKASFLNVHREAQGKIVDWLNESGVETTAGAALTKDNLVNVAEVKAWSRDLTLSLIFNGVSNAVDDVFSQKAKHYKAQAEDRRDRAKLRLDLDDDGDADLGESINMGSKDLIRE